ncbi:MAG: DUF3429 domain-containing protein [Rhodobiaceae bacterium]|nr:MAG: DUF3429 domain-containing protein [Rhodobiaceae bacterium]
MARRAWLTRTPAPLSPFGARLVGFAGLIPFAGTGVLAWIAWPSDMAHAAVQAQLVYGAIILSFLGGIRWGIAMTKRGHFIRRAPDGFGTELALAAVPALVGWVVLFIPLPAALVVLSLFFAAQALSDLRAVKSQDAPDWFGPLRIQLTFFVVLALAVSFVRLLID